MPTDPIEFWFDFSSAYAYFASAGIDNLAQRHGRSVLWRPFMLGVAFKHTGMNGRQSTLRSWRCARSSMPADAKWA